MCQPFCITDKYGRRQSVPCGKCYECLRAKQQEWCFRLDQELKASYVSYFVTLTYEDDNLIFADDEPCLYKRHLQLHFKKIRKECEPKTIKYYAVGEYGDHGCRPHYHYLIFYRGSHDKYYIFDLIKKSWQYGFSKVLPVDGAQGYVTKYIMKFDKREHLVKPFSLISHGLGIDYLSKRVIKYHRDGLISYAVKPGGFRVALPRYYRDKIFTPLDRLIIQKRQSLYRQDLNIEKLKRFDLQLSFGVNPFEMSVRNYQNRLYQQMKLYKQKKKL